MTSKKKCKKRLIFDNISEEQLLEIGNLGYTEKVYSSDLVHLSLGTRPIHPTTDPTTGCERNTFTMVTTSYINNFLRFQHVSSLYLIYVSLGTIPIHPMAGCLKHAVIMATNTCLYNLLVSGYIKLIFGT